MSEGSSVVYLADTKKVEARAVWNIERPSIGPKRALVSGKNLKRGWEGFKPSPSEA